MLIAVCAGAIDAQETAVPAAAATQDPAVPGTAAPPDATVNPAATASVATVPPAALAEPMEASPWESLAAIRKAAESHVRSLIPAGAGENTITAVQLDNRLRLAHCPPKDLSAALPAGATLQARSLVGVSCNGPVHWSLFVPVNIESTVAVLVLNRAVNRETRLTAADVSIEKRRLAGPGSAWLSSTDELVGRTVRRPLSAGTTLSADMFSADLIVRRGQEVTLLSNAGTIEVRASGRAMIDGAAGSRIQVQNLSSMRVIEGVVETADLVRVAR